MPKRFIALLAGLLLGPGCSAIYPLHGVPAAYMPAEYKAPSREGKSTIDLSLLQRSQSDQYHIAAGDVLAIYAPGLLGLVSTQPDLSSGDNPPINLPANPVDLPSLGFPVTVRDDNTIQIPQLPAIDVYGLTEREVEDRLKQAAVQAQKMGPDPRIVVSMMRQRTYRVLVCRQESATAPTPTVMAGMIDIGRTGKGTSRVVDLRAGENDVAHALAQPGVDGLPGLDARNVIYVIRARNARSRTMDPAHLEPQPTPTPLTQRRHGGPTRELVVRGQSPSRGIGNSSPSGKSPYGYLTASQFNLSGQDIALGSTGPALIEPIPGMMPPQTLRVASGNSNNFASNGFDPSVGSQIQGSRGGYIAPDGPAFRDPTYSTRNQVGPVGSQFSTNGFDQNQEAQNSGTHHERFAADAPAFRDPTYSARGQVGPISSQFIPDQSAASPRSADQFVPADESLYQPVQYSTFDSQYSVPQSGPWPTSGGVGTPAMLGPNVINRYPSNSSSSMQNSNSSNPIPVGVEPAPSLGAGHSGVAEHTPVWQQTLQNFDPTVENSHIIKIPVRLAPGENLDLSEEDITLYDGDIVFIENRDTDVYFVGGLLGGGQYSLPRDRDLHILEAVSLAQGRGTTQAGVTGLQSSGGVSALNRDVTPGASRLIILRQVGCEQVMTVEVDLYKALRYPHENILVQPSDMLILQYTPVEATLAFLQRNIFEGALLGIAAGSFQSGK